MRTVSYSDLKDRFTSAIGVDSLLSVEETAFKNSLNDRVKGAWTRAQWPELMSLKEKTVAAITTPLVADKAVQIDKGSWSERPEVFEHRLAKQSPGEKRLYSGTDEGMMYLVETSQGNRFVLTLQSIGNHQNHVS